MNTRRDALRILAIASGAMPALASAQETKEVGDQPGHLHTGPAIQVPAPSQPTFFQPSEFRVVEALANASFRVRILLAQKMPEWLSLIDKAIVAEPATLMHLPRRHCRSECARIR